MGEVFRTAELGEVRRGPEQTDSPLTFSGAGADELQRLTLQVACRRGTARALLPCFCGRRDGLLGSPPVRPRRLARLPRGRQVEWCRLCAQGADAVRGELQQLVERELALVQAGPRVFAVRGSERPDLVVN